MRGLAVVLGAVVFAACSVDRQPLVVFAAASATEVSAGLAESFEGATGIPVVVSTAASSTLARQIEAGAPAEVALLVGEEWPDWLEVRERIGDLVPVARGHLVVVQPSASPEVGSLGGLADMDRVALADPAHVPAGRFAREALTRAGLWDRVQPRAVYLPNVRAALAAVAGGHAQAALVYASDATVAKGIQIAPVLPDSLQPRIVWTCAAVTGARREAKAFCEHARNRLDVWTEAGFEPLRQPVSP